MMRLTKSKLRGIELPDLPMIGKGNTSIIFDNGDSIIGYTIEQLKVEWLHFGLGISDHYEYAGEACYTGFKYNRFNHRTEYVHEYLDVYRYVMPKLEILGTRNRGVKLALKEIDSLRSHAFTKGRYNPGLHWLALAEHRSSALSIPANFILNYDTENIYPDFGYGDWAMVNNEPVCIDPFHHKNVNDALRLTRYA